MKRAYFEYFIDRLKEKGPLQETIMGYLMLEYLLVQALKIMVE
jgi:hypothetical protein